MYMHCRLVCAAALSTVALGGRAVALMEAPNAEKNPAKGKKEDNVDKHLLNERRVVFISGRIDEKSACKVVSQLLYLDQGTGTKFDGVGSRGGSNVAPITMLISSPGGQVTAGLGIYDTMQWVRAPVHTVVIGHASSMAAVLLASGTPGHRRAARNARIMVHEASQGISKTKLGDVLWRAEELRAKNEMLVVLLAKHSGKCVEEVRRIMRAREDVFLSAEEAKAWGLVDEVIDVQPPTSSARVEEIVVEEAGGNEGSKGGGNEGEGKTA